MPRLVVLSEGLTGRTHELKVEVTTTIGRVEDNSFQISHPSISSHHCEVRLQGNDLVVKDLDSTNGSFILGKQITEAVLKPSQIVRFGQIDVRFEHEGVPSAPQKKVFDHTQIVPQGIKANDLDQTARAPTVARFEKKTNRPAIIFAIIAGIAVLAAAAWVISVVMGVGDKP